MKDVSYYRLAEAGHCPYSLVRVRTLRPVVNDFFLRTLGAGERLESGREIG
jgi:hypothetical protein